MLNKSLTLQKEMKNESQNIVAYFNSQISVGYGNINVSIQVNDKEYISANNSKFKEELDMFFEDIKREATLIGWVGLKEEE